MKRLYSPVIATYLAILTLGISLFFQTFGLPSKHLSHLTPKGLPPSKITCLTIGSRGDVQPFIALGLGLQQDGHTVTIATHLEFKDMIEESGIAFKNIGGNPQELIKHCVEHGFFSLNFFIAGYTKFRGWINELLVTVPAACAGADVLIESPTAMMGIHVAESMKIPYFRAFTMPWTPTTEYPHPFTTTSPRLGMYHYRISYNVFNYLIWKGIESKVNKWREHKLKLKPTSFAKLRSAKIPILYNFSEQIIPKPHDWDEWTHVTGYWFRDQQHNTDDKKIEDSISPDLRSFLQKAKDDQKKVIYIGFGSVIFPNAQEVQRNIEEAVKKAGVCAVVSGGWSDMKAHEKDFESVGTASPSLEDSPLHFVGAVPHEWLFSQVDATLTHGGAGTTAASLRAGIPTFIKPFFGDQFFWAKRVEKMGVGSHVKNFEISELVRVITQATSNSEKIDNAKKIGEAIFQENGVRTAIMKLYQDMNHARRIMLLGLSKGEKDPIPKFPKDKLYSWVEQYLKEEKASIHFSFLLILRSLQASSISKQSTYCQDLISSSKYTESERNMTQPASKQSCNIP
ncbi:hypothetical protein PCASD_20269 [Puccinia coronata f. sp. avenae]|uniref:sterol 3beta-glucosyltransferase n=1 Tax=Puccinia coronata f. sp. avenae TaxID=200324 RepID=A0A2N5SCN7_9BASI|nr:hypothetical protein PCASD_20269 [Puccinia coronata f. sp. avenae]